MMKTMLKRLGFTCFLVAIFCTAVFAGGGYDFPMMEPADGYFVTNIQEGYYDEADALVIWNDASYSYEFDENGNTTTMLISNGHLDETYTFTYTEDNLLLTENYVNSDSILDQYTTTYTYDNSGNLIEKTLVRSYAGDELKFVTTFSYDENNLVIEEKSYGFDGSLSDITTYSYNDQAQLISKQIETIVPESENLVPRDCYSFTYDSSGKCVAYKEEHSFFVKSTNEVHLSHSYTYRYEYDEIGNNIKVTASSTIDADEVFLLEYEKLQETNKPENPFSDVTDDSWYVDAVLWAAAEGITVGTGDGQFKPNDICDRGQVMTFLHRAVDTPAPTIKNVPFTDVKSGMWYTDAILWAYEEEISNGVNAEGTLFGLTNKMTRSQIVTLLYRLAGSPDVNGADLPFEDVKADTWYTNAVIWAVQEGITTGTDKGFEPDKPLTRAETVTFLKRYVNG